MSYQPHPRLESVLNLMRKHQESYEVNFLGKKVTVFPNVFSPRYSPSAAFHVKNMPNQKDKAVLEIGSGSGVISLLAALQGASQVVAVDINPDAVENTKANFERYNVQNACAMYSNLFENVTGKFDTIIFAAPYYGNKPKDTLEMAASDYNYQTLASFMENAHKYLKDEGQVQLGFSDTGDTELLHKLVRENNYRIVSFKEETFIDWKAQLYILALNLR